MARADGCCCQHLSPLHPRAARRSSFVEVTGAAELDAPTWRHGTDALRARPTLFRPEGPAPTSIEAANARFCSAVAPSWMVARPTCGRIAPRWPLVPSASHTALGTPPDRFPTSLGLPPRVKYTTCIPLWGQPSGRPLRPFNLVQAANMSRRYNPRMDPAHEGLLPDIGSTRTRDRVRNRSKTCTDPRPDPQPTPHTPAQRTGLTTTTTQPANRPSHPADRGKPGDARHKGKRPHTTTSQGRQGRHAGQVARRMGQRTRDSNAIR